MAKKKQQGSGAQSAQIEQLPIESLIPYARNSRSNLVALCVRHHKVVECLTVDIENTGSDVATMKTILGSIISERMMATVSVLRSIHAAT